MDDRDEIIMFRKKARCDDDEKRNEDILQLEEWNSCDRLDNYRHTTGECAEVQSDNEKEFAIKDDDDNNNDIDDESDDELMTFDPTDEEISGNKKAIEAIEYILLTEIGKETESSCETALDHLVAILDAEYNFTAKLSCFNELGGQFKIVAALRKWPTNTKVQCAGCTVFALLSNSPSFLYNEKTIQVSCGLQCILEAMNKFPKHSDIQVSACCVLSRCCCFPNYASYAVFERHCIESIVSSMMTFPDNQHVERWGCWALATISRWSNFRPLILDAGGLGILAFAIGKVSDREKVDEEVFHKATRSALQRLMKIKNSRADPCYNNVNKIVKLATN